MERQKQADRILLLLQQYTHVPLPAILALGIASHTRRIFELRQRGWIIEMEDYWVGRERRVTYMLRGKLSNQPQLATDDGFIEATDAKATQA